jgi:toxin CcdB
VAQFDVHRTLGPRAKTFPYVLILQSRRYDRLTTRLCAPLVLRDLVPPGAQEPFLTPTFTIEARAVVLNPFEIFPIPLNRLGEWVASLADDDDARSKVIQALDEVVSQARMHRRTLRCR